MNLENKRVIHANYGAGRITSAHQQDASGARMNLQVRFDGSNAVQHFHFPSDFESGSSLMFADAKDKTEYEDFKKRQKQTKAAQNKKSPSGNGTGKKQGSRSGSTSETVYKTEIKRHMVSYTAAGVTVKEAAPGAETGKAKNNPASQRSIPPSERILQVELSARNCKQVFTIVKSPGYQDSDAWIFCKDRGRAKAVIAAVMQNEPTVTIDENTYGLKVLERGKALERIEKDWKHFQDPYTRNKLYIFRFHGTAGNPEGYEIVQAYMYFPAKKCAFETSVYYQSSSDRYFMNEESFQKLVKKHGLPAVELVFPESEGGNGSSGWISGFNLESKLKLLGYSVGKNDGLNTGERQRLLQSIIQSGQMQDYEVINHLELLIHLNANKDNMEDACECWQEDITFIQNGFRENRKAVDFTVPVASGAAKHTKYVSEAETPKRNGQQSTAATSVSGGSDSQKSGKTGSATKKTEQKTQEWVPVQYAAERATEPAGKTYVEYNPASVPAAAKTGAPENALVNKPEISGSGTTVPNAIAEAEARRKELQALENELQSLSWIHFIKRYRLKKRIEMLRSML